MALRKDCSTVLEPRHAVGDVPPHHLEVGDHQWTIEGDHRGDGNDQQHGRDDSSRHVIHLIVRRLVADLRHHLLFRRLRFVLFDHIVPVSQSPVLSERHAISILITSSVWSENEKYQSFFIRKLVIHHFYLA